MPTPVVGMVGASVAGGVVQAGAARSAAKSQERAADQQLELQREVYDDTTQNHAPYRQAGNAALDAYMFEMGLGPRPGTQPAMQQPAQRVQQPKQQPQAQPGSGRLDHGLMTGRLSPEQWAAARRGGGQPNMPDGNSPVMLQQPQQQTASTPYRGFRATPGYQFRVDQGNDSINALAGAQGGLFSGKTLESLARFNQGIASEEYGNYMNRLAGMTDMGMGAAGNQATAGNVYAAGAGNALAARGNASAAGAIGVGNAIGGAINNGIGIWQYQNAMNQGAMPGYG